MTTSPKNSASVKQPSEGRAKLLFAILFLALAVAIAIAVRNQPIKLPDFTWSAETTQPGFFKVLEAADGDTIKVDMNGVKETIRLIGVDTPETHHPEKPVQCFGEAASNFTKSWLEGHSVRLESDPASTNRDRYNRLLRYVYTEDGELVNKTLILEGYGFAYTSFPFGKLEEFRQAEQSARQDNRGLWSGCPIDETSGFPTTGPAQ